MVAAYLPIHWSRLLKANICSDGYGFPWQSQKCVGIKMQTDLCELELLIKSPVERDFPFRPHVAVLLSDMKAVWVFFPYDNALLLSLISLLMEHLPKPANTR